MVPIRTILIRPFGHVRHVMTDPTDDHPFTFGCFRAVETPDVPPIDAPIDEPASGTDHDDAPTDDPDATENTDAASPTPIPDGGTRLAGACPTCESTLANVQGVPACTNCTWTAN